MTTMVAELYDALRKAGVEDDLAKSAAKAVLGIEQREALATKTDVLAVTVEVHKMASTLTWRMLAVMGGMTGLFTAIVKW